MSNSTSPNWQRLFARTQEALGGIARNATRGLRELERSEMVELFKRAGHALASDAFQQGLTRLRDRLDEAMPLNASARPAPTRSDNAGRPTNGRDRMEPRSDTAA